MSALDQLAQLAVKAAKPTEKLPFGPWEGSMRSVTADLVPREFLASPAGTESDWLYLPNYGSWLRRGGQTVKFDTLSGGASVTGLLPAKWSARARWSEEFLSDSVTDGIPTVATLLTKETMASGLDDGYFSNLWWRDQVGNANRTLCDEYGSTTYNAAGALQTYRVVPLWYDSGDGGITRGVSEFARRYLLSGSRRFHKVGKQWYFPSYRGTPARWDGNRATAASVTTLALNSDVTLVDTQLVRAGSAPAATTFGCLTTLDDSVSYVQAQDDASRTYYFGLNGTAADSTTYTISYRARRNGAVPQATTYFQFAIMCSGQQRYTSGQIYSAPLSTSWTNYTAIIVCDGSNGSSGLGANRFEIGEAAPVGATGSYVEITYVSVSSGSASTATVNHLMPSGPIPPTHAGTIVPGAAVLPTYARPTATTALNSWVAVGAASAHLTMDETTADDSDYARSNASNTVMKIRLGALGFVPTNIETVTVRFRIRNVVYSGNNNLNVALYNGATNQGSKDMSFSTTTAFYDDGFTLTAAQITAVASWAALDVWFTTSSESTLFSTLKDESWVSYVALEYLPAAATLEGGWKGKDRFYKAMYYRYEDDSIWALTTPRAPNNVLRSGLDLVTVSAANPTTAFSSVTWSNIPIPPPGVRKIGLCRGPKIDSSVSDNLQLNPTDMRLVAEVDAGTTSYEDFFGDDEAMKLDPERAFIRYDHIMSPRARYIFAGDMRVCHSYGGTSPVAIELAPVGRSSDFDLNLKESDFLLYAQDSSYFQIQIDAQGLGTLVLGQSDGTTLTSTSYAFLNYDTLQKLVDVINNTSCAVDGQQWRAQLCPGVSPDATSLSLTPHSRAIGGCVVSGQTITRTSGGLSKVAVGNLISGTGVTAGAYVSRIDSDTQLTFVGTITAATKTLTFYTELGDAPTSALANNGYQRAFGNCLPSFMYFTKTYLNTQTLDKSATWMTVAAPGSIKSAANCFRSENRFTPPLEAGIAMGGAGVDNGFVVFYANKRGAIRNTRDMGTGRDQDYRLFITNESSGCVAWNTVVSGNRCAVALAPEGLVVCDLFNEHPISWHIYSHPISDATTGVGDFSYEIPQSIAATAADNDSSYATARVMRSAVWVNYRTSASATHNNRQVMMDFSAAANLNGVAALFRAAGKPWGWSYPLVRSLSVMCEGRRGAADGSGAHLYGWNDANAGGTGDGRIDEFETGSTDNGTAIAGTLAIPWQRAGEMELLSVQEIFYEHSSPAGSTGSLVFHRSFSNDNYTLTPGTSALTVSSEIKMLTTPARANANAFYIAYAQATGSARELRRIEARIKRVKRLK